MNSPSFRLPGSKLCANCPA
ncbi:MAG: (2Fe-2S)-binding protein [Saprospiraceae bacterium]